MKKKILFSFVLIMSIFFTTKVSALQNVTSATGVFGYTYGNYSPDTNNHRNVTWTGTLPVELLTSIGQVNKTLWGVNYNFTFPNVFSGSYITNSVDTYMGIQQNNISTYLGSNFPVTAVCTSHNGDTKTVNCTLDSSASNKRIYKCTCSFTNYDYPSSASMTIGITNSFLATSPFVSYTGNNTTSSIYVSNISWEAKSSSDPNTGKLDDIKDSIEQGTQDIIDSQQQTTDAINDLNDTLQEVELDDETIGDKVGDIDTISETPITDLITMPLVLLNKISSSSSSSCSPYVLPFKLWGSTSYSVSLPCFDGSSYLGNVWNIIDALLCFFMIYNIGMMLINFFEQITSLNDVFDSLYVPKHGSYVPKHGGGK